MTIIINQNTTWKSGETINLTQEIQVPLGVTLTIESGAIVNGNGFQLSIYGKLYANGSSNAHITFNNLNIVSSNSYSNPSYTNLNYIEMQKGSFITPAGSNMFGNFDITNSIFNEVKGFYLIFPDSKSTIIGNIFNKSEGIQISGPVLIKNNLFLEQSTNYAVQSWGTGATIESNSFLSTDRVALSLRPNSITSLTAIDNYFGTTDASIIDSMIFDQKDTLNCFSIISTSHSDKPASATPALDTIPPSVAITSNTKTLNYNQTANITFTLSEPSTNFTIYDIVVTGGTLSNFSGTSGTYTATFTPSTNFSGDGTVSILSDVFSDAAGNVNTDGLDANNKWTFTRTITVLNEKHSLSVIVDKGVLSSSAMLLKGLNESITYTDGIVTKHSVEYSRITFDYSQVDSLITTVLRDDEFTSEFRKELSDAAPSTTNLSYKDTVFLVGLNNIDSALLMIAGIDGNFVG